MDSIFGKLMKKILLCIISFITLTGCSKVNTPSFIKMEDIHFQPLIKLNDFCLNSKSKEASMFDIKGDNFYFETIYIENTEILKTDEIFSYNLKDDILSSIKKNKKDIRYRSYITHKNHSYYVYLEKNKQLKEPYKISVIDEYKGSKYTIAEGYTWHPLETPDLKIVNDSLYFLMESLSPDDSNYFGDGKLTFKLISYKNKEAKTLIEGDTIIKDYSYKENSGQFLPGTTILDNGDGNMLWTYRDNGTSVISYYSNGQWTEKKLDEVIYLNAYRKNWIFYSTENHLCLYNTKTDKVITLKENHQVISASGFLDNAFIYFSDDMNGNRPIYVLQANNDSYKLDLLNTPENIVAFFMNDNCGIALGDNHLYKINI